MKPDFAKLRAERNAHNARVAEQLQSEGWLISPCAFEDDDACYCACGRGGPCEHQWDGKPWVSADGREYSVTCSKCGMTAMQHTFRCASFL